MDARIEATRRRLHEAILRLTARKDVSTISVAELAREAGIDRSTFYAHAASPVDVLRSALSEDLDPLRVEADELVDGTPDAFADAGRMLNARLIDHLERYEAVYADRASGRPSSALHTVLSDHVRTSLELVLGHLADLGTGRAQTGTELDRSYLAAFIAHGIVGAISVWLNTPAPRDPRQLEAVLDLVYSSWLLPGAQSPR
ncbi:AcrR family transcriptional regulator [Compostimonas suwonensis]|uniref:AcrR family transcriptional regulator n=1 Tax=Compostimonas suwonensis TaxID=1048394 RepID=A0A2M9BWT0_9MICO|nr:TetR/AcrR family transcriptional regulator [Compostimonas suwonensis]PJJ62416.1 AcrR family transcriptional regulator [Compostimonas suwonensis]